MEEFKFQVQEQVVHFLPKGYPATVSEGYARFAIGQSLAAVFGSIGGILSVQALLLAIGMNAGAIPLAATLNWVIKDGVGQFGGVVFNSMVSGRFDADPKKWRMVAAVSMEVSSFMELLTPLAPAHFLFIASIANIGKNVSFLAASASRAAIHKSFALHENLADVTAKTNSQSVLTSMIGTGLGISIAAMIGDQYPYTVGTFLVCSLLGQFFTYYSLSHVTINTLSPHRLEYLLADYLGTSCQSLREGTADVRKVLRLIEQDSSALNSRDVLSPQHLRRMERWLKTRTCGLSAQFVGSNVDAAIRSEEEMQVIRCGISDARLHSSVYFSFPRRCSRYSAPTATLSTC